MTVELEDLKSAWQSVKPNIDAAPATENVEAAAGRRSDIKARLQRRWLWDGAFTSACFIGLSTSRLWAPVKLPAWWIACFCAVILAGILCGAYLYRKISGINLWEDPNTRIMTTVVKINKLYKNAELALSIATLPLLVWMALTPPVAGTLRMWLVLCSIPPAFAIEFMLYRSNMKHLNNLND